MASRATSRLRKLAALRGGEVGELAHAQWALICAQVVVWTRPVGKLATPADSGAEPIAPPPEMQARAARLALAVGRAAENGVFRPLCLVRAVALQRMLEQKELKGSRIRIGVQRRGERFAAHAWVEYGPLLLGDAEWHVRRFTPLTDVRPVSHS